ACGGLADTAAPGRRGGGARARSPPAAPPPPVYAIPGNHDVGDEPPGQEAEQLIDERRLQRWLSVFGADRFALDLDSWRVLGLNAQLLGSGLPQEMEQDAWLDGELSGSVPPRVLVAAKPRVLET